MKWAVIYSDKDAGAIRIATPQTMGQWADTIAVSLMPTDSGTVVNIRSTLGQSPNRENVKRYLAELGKRLAAQSQGFIKPRARLTVQYA